MSGSSVAGIDRKLKVVVIPVSDVDRAKDMVAGRPARVAAAQIGFTVSRHNSNNGDQR
jgi:hypothetical protein